MAQEPDVRELFKGAPVRGCFEPPPAVDTASRGAPHQLTDLGGGPTGGVGRRVESVPSLTDTSGTDRGGVSDWFKEKAPEPEKGGGFWESAGNALRSGLDAAGSWLSL